MPDVVVIGAGPAGLSASRTTAAAGLETVVLERQAAVAEHVRTSGATAVETVARLGTPSSLFHVLERMRISSPSADARFDGASSICVLDVRGFYRWLAAQAEAAGAVVRTGVTAKQPLLDGNRVVGVSTDDEELRARIVIDAGGHRAQLSKRAGLHPGFQRFGVGAEHELDAPQADQGEAVLIVGQEYAPAGYAWSLPWGGSRVRVGVGIHHSDVRNDPRRHLERLVRDEERFGLGLGGARVVEHHYGLIPAEGAASQFVADGIVAVGDAAGQPSLVLGEGIRISILAGELAGETVASALRAGSASAEALRPYEERFAREFARDLRVGAILNRRLAATRSDAHWAARLRVLQTMPTPLVLDLLQSRISVGAILRWYAGHPRAVVRAPALLRALLGSP